MKKSEIILDFTSLLDVTMIILFFFIINYSAHTNDITRQAQEKIESAQALAAEAQEDIERTKAEREELERERTEQRELAQAEMERLYGASSHAASSLEAMRAFENEKSVRIILKLGEDGWYIEVYSDRELLRSIEKGTDIYTALKDTFTSAGFTRDDVFLVTFLYDSEMAWSHSARPAVEDALDRLRNDLPYLYCATVDTADVGS